MFHSNLQGSENVNIGEFEGYGLSVVFSSLVKKLHRNIDTKIH